MTQWDLTNFNRFILESEDDHDSPYNEELAQQTRQNIVGLLLLMLDTGDSGSATVDPPNDNTGVLTDGAAAYNIDEHNGRTLLITSGNARGLFYTIDDTTATQIICTGDNLYAAGMRSGDTFKVLYDLINSTLGHSHNSTDSRLITTLADDVVTPAKLKSTCHAGGSGNISANSTISISMQDYSFFPATSVNDRQWIHMTGGASYGDCVGRFSFYNRGAVQRTYGYRYRYIHASGPTYMYIIKDKRTGLIQHMAFAEDPPLEDQKFIVMTDSEGKLLDMSEYEEIVIIDFDMGIVDEMIDISLSKKKFYHETLNEDFTFNKKKKIFIKNNLIAI